MEDNIVHGWRTSSYSGNGGGNCIEVGTAAQAIAIRDTKKDGAGPVLRLSLAAWRKFTDQVKCSLPSDANPTSRGMHRHPHSGTGLSPSKQLPRPFRGSRVDHC
jgi:hypothetical protein